MAWGDKEVIKGGPFGTDKVVTENWDGSKTVSEVGLFGNREVVKVDSSLFGTSATTPSGNSESVYAPIFSGESDSAYATHHASDVAVGIDARAASRTSSNSSSSSSYPSSGGGGYGGYYGSQSNSTTSGGQVVLMLVFGGIALFLVSQLMLLSRPSVPVVITPPQDQIAVAPSEAVAVVPVETTSYSSPPVKHAYTGFGNFYYKRGSDGDFVTSGPSTLGPDLKVEVAGKPKEYQHAWGSISLVKTAKPRKGYYPTKDLLVFIREQPDSASGEVGRVDMESPVEVVTGSDNNGWVQVVAPYEGWIYTN